MIWILVAVIVVLVCVIGAVVVRQQRARKLKDDFGPEYDRVVAQKGDERAGEQELLERRRRYDQFEIRPLAPSARDVYRRRWETTQRGFVDRPEEAVGQASVLVRQVMQDRGYPVDGDFEQLAADVSVEHPVVVQNYRAAHAISVRAGNGQASTEDLRRSLVHFRALFGELLAGEHDGSRRRSDRGEISQPTKTRG